MSKVILLVTLIVSGQPPYTYQVGFPHQVPCTIAKGAIEKAYDTAFSNIKLTYSAICIETGF
jgi:hypothetical protein